MSKNLLTVQNLSLKISNDKESFFPVRDISFQMQTSEIIGIIGESASGKTLATKALLKMLPSNVQIEAGQILFQQNDILQKTEKEMTCVRGKEIAYIPQNPHLSLNPTKKIGAQITESLRYHLKLSKKESYKRAISLLGQAKIVNPQECFNLYPHEMSGGMKQRVIIAIAISLNPKILIADEPTTALDVILQNEILQLLKTIQKEKKIGIIFITHDMAVASHLCDKIFVMYAGEILENGNVKDIINEPKHPYTKMLLESVPTLEKNKHFNPLKVNLGSVPQCKQIKTICPFIARCSNAMRICTEKKPPTFIQKSKVNCWLYDKRHPLNRDQKSEKEFQKQTLCSQ